MNETRTYNLGDEELSLARMSLERYQNTVRLYASLPVNAISDAITAFQEEAAGAVRPGANAEDLTEVEISVAPLVMAIKSGIEEMLDNNFLVEMVANVLGIEPERAKEIDYDVGLEAITDFFTQYPGLLRDSIRFFKALIPIRMSSPSTTTQEQESEPSSDSSTPSPKRPEGEAEEVTTEKKPEKVAD